MSIPLRDYLFGEKTWRDATWNQRLVSFLSPAAAAGGRNDPLAADVRSRSGLESLAPTDEGSATDTSHQAHSPPLGGVPRVSDLSSKERPTIRPPRFRALSERLSEVEFGVENLASRLARRETRWRRRGLRLNRMLARILETSERQHALLSSILLVIERIERRQSHSADPHPRREATPPRPSYFRPNGSTTPHDASIPALDVREQGLPSRAEPYAAGAYGSDSPAVSGTLTEISLATILSMFELEHRTGRLSLAQIGEPDISFDLLDGVVVGSKLDALDADPVIALQRGLELKDGRFVFSQGTVLAGTARARSVGSLLLEATRRNDEAVR